MDCPVGGGLFVDAGRVGLVGDAAVTDPREARISDPRADTIRQALNLIREREQRMNVHTGHPQFLDAVADIEAAVDGLLADAAEARELAATYKADRDDYDEILGRRMAERDEAIASRVSAYAYRDAAEQRLVAAEARVATLETALHELRETVARHDGPELRHWLGSQDVVDDARYREAAIIHAAMRAALAASAPAKHDPIGLHGEGRPNAYAPSAPATQQETE